MAQTRPNIILFSTDQHRGDFVGLSGESVAETPNLDAFVREGAYFPNAYTEIPSTTGARRVLLGGMGSWDCGLVGFEHSEWHERNTLAQCLADAGYHCLNVGFRNLHPRRKLYGFHQVVPHDLCEGQDDYWDWLRAELGTRQHERAHGADANGWLARPWHLEERYHPTNWTTDTALELIEHRDPTRPFFIWVSHLRPHSPYDPPAFFWELYREKAVPQPVVGSWVRDADRPPEPLERTAAEGRLSPERNRRMRVGYLGCITHIDYQLGYLQEVLTKWKLWRDTLLVFVSDHGDMMGDHHLHRKCHAYEGSARVPFVVRYPEGMPTPRGRFDHVVGLQDVMPTILEAAGVPIPPSVTGRSVFAAARGEPWREYLHGEHSPCYALEHGMHYLTDGRQKYIWFAVTGREQLFDLRADRLELEDLAATPAGASDLLGWRERLVRLLAGRADGFSDGRRLIPKPQGYGPAATPGSG